MDYSKEQFCCEKNKVILIAKKLIKQIITSQRFLATTKRPLDPAEIGGNLPIESLLILVSV